MLKKHSNQYKFQMINLEDLVPQDHLLRKIDQYIDFSFIEGLTYDLYSHETGRPALDPVVLFKMLFIGYLFGIRSERRLVQEINVNLAYRWFIGFDLDEKIPDHSVFSQNRRRRFSQRPELEQEIFDNIVEQAVKYGLITGHFLYTDSTHIKANANKGKFVAVEIEVSPMEYLDQLQDDIDQKRAALDKKPLAKTERKETKEIKQSTTDPDSGFLHREGKPKGFFYLDHRTVDGQHGLIVDTHVTPGNVNDARPYPSRIRRILDRFGFDLWATGIDAGYKHPYIAKFLKELGVYGVSAYKRSPHRDKTLFYPSQYLYDKENDAYVCPFGQFLTPKTVNRQGYIEYRCDADVCRQCPMHNQCTKSKQKKIFRHVWQNDLDEMDSHRQDPRGKKIYERRKETVERSFADSKEMHGLRYARFRGLSKVRAQCLLVAACQNMKKIALLLARWDGQLGDPSIFVRCFAAMARLTERLLKKWRFAI